MKKCFKSVKIVTIIKIVLVNFSAKINAQNMQPVDNDSPFSRIPWSSTYPQEPESGHQGNGRRPRGQRSFASTTTGYSSSSNSSLGTAWPQENLQSHPRRFSMQQPFRSEKTQTQAMEDQLKRESHINNNYTLIFLLIIKFPRN